MNDLSELIVQFIKQAKSGELTTAQYPREWGGLKMKVSFGQGMPARIPWISFTAPEISVSKGIYPVYLYYKDLKTLILAYGVSETAESPISWPVEIINNIQTVGAFFDKDVPRYGSSFMFKAYKVEINGDKVIFTNHDNKNEATGKDLDSDLITLIEYYKKVVALPNSPAVANINQGLFYMEKQLEDFIIHNWEKTELGKRFDLIIEEGEPLSQQYKTDIGPIDILAKDKRTNSYVVIELKKNQTSDDTVGQIARYMGWIKDVKKDADVSGVIIAGDYDKKLDYALSIVPNVEVYLYKVDFTLEEFKGVK